MIPEWIVNILEKGGIWGAIVFVLLVSVAGLVAYVKSLQAKADKVYGYRLAERDTLNKTLSDSSKVLEGIIRANEDRNELMNEQADLILKQAHALELLKVSVVSQYENIKDHNTASAQAVASMADAIRSLSITVAENRNIAQQHVMNVQKSIDDMAKAVTSAVSLASQAHIVEMRTLLGHVTTVHRKRKVTK
jgi:hypothetical protein